MRDKLFLNLKRKYTLRGVNCKQVNIDLASIASIESFLKLIPPFSHSTRLAQRRSVRRRPSHEFVLRLQQNRELPTFVLVARVGLDQAAY